MIYTHTPFTVTTHPNQHSLCGELIYLPTMDGGLLTSVTYPVSYSEYSGELIVQSQSNSQVGLKEITIRGSFADYS